MIMLFVDLLSLEDSKWIPERFSFYALKGLNESFGLSDLSLLLGGAAGF